MRTYPSTVAGLVLVLLIGILAACSQSSIGLFESIELERKIIDDRALDNDLLVGAIAKSSEQYFIAAATLWHRAVVDVDYPNDVAQWFAIAAPGTANFTTSSLAVFDGSGLELIYAAYSSQDGTEGGVYTIDPAVDLGSVEAASKVFGTELADVAGIGKIFVVNDGTATQILVGVRKTTISRYSLYASTTGASGTFAEVDGSDNNLPIIDVAESSTGQVAFLTRKAILIDSGGLNAGAPPVDVTPGLSLGERQPEFGGVYYNASADTLWVTDNEGFLYQSPDFGTTWTNNLVAHPVSTNVEDPLEFTDMIAVNNGASELLVVGTEGRGYRELDADFNPTTPAAEGSNYQASELARATVLAFFVDPGVSGFVPTETGETSTEVTGDRLFAGTSNLGLWKVLYTGNPPQWVRE
jgi:hypothetical protein